MDEGYMIVEFDTHCGSCIHHKKEENESPCDECLENPVNLYTKKPIKYERKED